MKKLLTVFFASMLFCIQAKTQCLPGATDQTFFQTDLVNPGTAMTLEPFGNNVIVGSNPGSTGNRHPLMLLSPALQGGASSFDANPAFSNNFESGTIGNITYTMPYGVTGQVNDIVIEPTINNSNVFDGDIYACGEQSLYYQLTGSDFVVSQCNNANSYLVGGVIKLDQNGVPDLSFVVDWNAAGYNFSGAYRLPIVVGIAQDPVNGNLFVACAVQGTSAPRILEIDSNNGCVLNIFPLITLAVGNHVRMEFDNPNNPARLYVCQSGSGPGIQYNTLGTTKSDLLILDVAGTNMQEFNCDWLQSNGNVRDILVDPLDPTGETLICAGSFTSIQFTGGTPSQATNHLFEMRIPANGIIANFNSLNQVLTVNGSNVSAGNWSINDIVIDDCPNIIYAGFDNQNNSFLRRCSRVGAIDNTFNQTQQFGNGFREILMLNNQIWVAGDFTQVINGFNSNDVFIACNTIAQPVTHFSYCKQVGATNYQILFNNVPNPGDPNVSWLLTVNGVIVNAAPTGDGAFQAYMNTQNFQFTDLVVVTRTISVGAGSCTVVCGHSEQFVPANQCNLPFITGGSSRSAVQEQSSNASAAQNFGHSTSMVLFPNPAKSNLTLRPNNIQNSAAVITLFDNLGKQVYNQNVMRFDPNGELIEISDLPSGSYIIVVEQQNEIWRSQFVKE
jgi:hypothetical protein